MGELRQYRRYTRHQKVTAVIAAELTNPTAAAKAAGIPKRTLSHWMTDPELAQIALKTREEMADDARRLAHIAYQALADKIIAGELEGRDLVMAYGVAIDKGQLLSGQATSRAEHRELLADFDDHERDALEEYLRERARERLRADA